MCVASAFPIATGKHIGDCDPVPSISASCTPALEAGDARSTASITNCVMAGTDGRTKVAKVGPLRARVKSAKVRPTPYVYYPPVGLREGDNQVNRCSLGTAYRASLVGLLLVSSNKL